jgi:hypothetical protein
VTSLEVLKMSDLIVAVRVRIQKQKSVRRKKLGKKLSPPLAFSVRQRIITYVVRLIHFFTCFWSIVMAAVKTGLTVSQKKLLAILAKYKGTKTVSELVPEYAKAMGKDEGEKGSLTTAISVLRKTVKAAKMKWPKELEPKHESGGGRSSERTDVAEALNGLGIDFEFVADDSDEDSDENAGE